MLLATSPQTLKSTFIGRLVSTTDMNLARSLNKRISLKRITRGHPARFTRTDDNTILVFAGRELYELEG